MTFHQFYLQFLVSCACVRLLVTGGERSINTTPKNLLNRSEQPKNSREEKKVGEENNITVTLKTVFYLVAEESTPISNYPLFLLTAMWLVSSFNIQMHLLPEKINCQL